MTEPSPQREQKREMPMPGVAAIALYLMLIAGTIVVGVVNGGHYPWGFLIFSAAFIAASGGLIVGFRWAWVLALAAVFLLMGYNFWVFSQQQQAAAVVQGFLNLVFFLYLIRPEVRARLR
ncbi:hypothetical protein [Terracidiphilus gabretensis]|jgi:hypothetical protein|uniref:hypothetical protein n=1 Tax=Terracidiphilus gabretensis TaxID=1577687 RepID=UPI00071B1C8C|nr:hypothetical protein [Terracidiphilus gabretensis]